jgi:hypothetical protein
VNGRKKVMKRGDGHLRKSYLLTTDVGERIQPLSETSLRVPPANDPIFAKFHEELINILRAAMPDWDVKMIDMCAMARDIRAKAKERKTLLRDAVIISTCTEIARPYIGSEDGHVLQINRLVDGNGSILGNGPRPGHPDIYRQLDLIRAKTITTNKRKPLIIMEDGAFSGKTLIYVIRKMKERGVEVDAVVLGFAFPKAVENIRKEFSGEIIVIDKIDDIVDWIPDHDLVPFVPNCGRVMGITVNGVNYPFYSHDGATYSMPYLMPFLTADQMEQWTSIPKEHLCDLSLFCLQWTLELFEKIELLNGREVRMSDLTNLVPKISTPIGTGQKHLPDSEVRVTSFLHDACHELV